MARSKYRTSSDVCADCGAPEPTWASINRAILLCDECCSIHRSLGRHVSYIKSLTKGVWNPNLLNMVRTLNDCGANSIWEHSLLDPSNSKTSRKKPQSRDLLRPVKEEFIKAKHQHLAFILHPSKDELCSDEDLSRQLHSSVRTGNLETSLRLLAQGANPNYFYKEKGTMPLHVAAKAGQALQIELLIANGGNPNLLDSNSQTPAEVARLCGHLELSDRLVECMYEVTDRLIFFLCNQKPDHKSGKHLIIPDWAARLERSDLAFEARNRLQKLPNHLLEQLTSDVYDEVDRRETESSWLAAVNLPEANSVPFLPVNPHLSSTRNQGRQKLARFTSKEFATLIIDILTEASQRHSFANSPKPQDAALTMLKKEFLGRQGSQMSDDEPLYDSVASDDDYAAITDNATTANEKMAAHLAKGLPSVVEVLKKQLTLSESTTKDLKEEIERLKLTIVELSQENMNLKLELKVRNAFQPEAEGITKREHNFNKEPVLDYRTLNPRLSQRPASMYETREGLRKSPTWNSSPKKDTMMFSRPSQTQNDWDYGASSLPTTEEVNRRTEQVTRTIQELWLAMKSPMEKEAFIPCAKRIRAAVAELAAIFPQDPNNDNVRLALRQLNGNTGRLQAECTALQRCSSDVNHIDRCLQQVRSSAYNIAKATKLLVTQFHVY